ncbi:MAG: hypothetical protein H6698_06530 [Myxococcales bacterium]|nr:hypothetical protein [Myxococcales bacterium]MCB9533963.1 hypothetical protein [Myxococcales bacterium]
MSTSTDVLVRRGDTDDAPLALCAPRVGSFAPSLAVGTVVGPRTVVGVLTTVGVRAELRVPTDVTGRVTALDVHHRDQGVEYGQVLCRVAPLGEEPAAASSGPAAHDGAAAGETVVRAQMDGQLYRRPGPDAPELAPVGARLAPGDRIALVEVMKFFYPVAWEGPGEVVVTRWFADDGRPIAAGAPILAVRPA